jgi:hypothetical protein
LDAIGDDLAARLMYEHSDGLSSSAGASLMLMFGTIESGLKYGETVALAKGTTLRSYTLKLLAVRAAQGKLWATE